MILTLAAGIAVFGIPVLAAGSCRTVGGIAGSVGIVVAARSVGIIRALAAGISVLIIAMFTTGIPVLVVAVLSALGSVVVFGAFGPA